MNLERQIGTAQAGVEHQLPAAAVTEEPETGAAAEPGQSGRAALGAVPPIATVAAEAEQGGSSVAAVPEADAAEESADGTDGQRLPKPMIAAAAASGVVLIGLALVLSQLPGGGGPHGGPGGPAPAGHAQQNGGPNGYVPVADARTGAAAGAGLVAAGQPSPPAAAPVTPPAAPADSPAAADRAA